MIITDEFRAQFNEAISDALRVVTTLEIATRRRAAFGETGEDIARGLAELGECREKLQKAMETVRRTPGHSAGVTKWGEGLADAMKNYRPGEPGKPA